MEVWEGEGMLGKAVVADTLGRSVLLFGATALPASGWVACL